MEELAPDGHPGWTVCWSYSHTAESWILIADVTSSNLRSILDHLPDIDIFRVWDIASYLGGHHGRYQPNDQCSGGA